MRSLRDPDRTRAAIIDAAATEFSLKGYDGTTLTAVARRAKLSKQLLHHYFSGKDELFREVHAARFRPADGWDDHLPSQASELFANRFEKRAKDHEYVRFLAWEAASARNSTVPGQKARTKRLGDYGDALKKMQDDGRLPEDLDHRLLQLAILSLATYPLAFSQITKLVTGYQGTDPAFQRAWADFLRKLGEHLFQETQQQPSVSTSDSDVVIGLSERKRAKLSTAKQPANGKKISKLTRAAS